MQEELQMVQNQIEGLKAKITANREAERAFLKAQGLDEQVEKTNKEIYDLEADIEDLKEKLNENRYTRKMAINTSLRSLQAQMDNVMPFGNAVFDINEDGKLLIGWFKDNVFVPHAALSGGEKVIFDGALCYVLLGESESNILIYEAAEADPQTLSQALAKLAGIKNQVILNTWFSPQKMDKKWNVIKT